MHIRRRPPKSCSAAMIFRPWMFVNISFNIFIPTCYTKSMKQTFRRPPKESNLPVQLEWLRSYARVMDDLFQIPGTKFRFGLDPLLGLIPWVGDLATGAFSGLILLTMVRHGVSGAVILRMTGNILLDYLLGSVPVLGDLFDVGFQANRRNIVLLEQFWLEGKYQGNGWGLMILALMVLGSVMLLTGWLIWKSLYWLGNVLF